MAYQSWSVVFGEQPSAAKWNILGTNDAGFNDGTNIQNKAYQLDNANSISSATSQSLKVQYGWAQKIGTAATAMSESITFPVAFGTIYGVHTSPAGISGADSVAGATITDFEVDPSTSAVCVSPVSITTSGYTASMTKSDGATFANNRFFAYSWIAWGI